jgi:hypothetical protein
MGVSRIRARITALGVLGNVNVCSRRRSTEAYAGADENQEQGEDPFHKPKFQN